MSVMAVNIEHKGQGHKPLACENVVRPEGLEPPTFGLEVRGSIHLS